MVGLPLSIADDQFENTVCKILQQIGANITGEKVESCYWLSKNTERTIVKFLRKKDCDQPTARRDKKHYTNGSLLPY